ncbi:MAG: sigma-70 family RNA polymerase sigma factor [Isosphaeraceae bacterium]
MPDLANRLRAGDAAAAEELYRSYAPYLRMVVRRQLTPQLRARFDSSDVVQSVWAETLLRARNDAPSWTFQSPSRLRSFLRRLTRNRFIDFYRRHRAALDHERPIAAEDVAGLDDPRCGRPSEAVRAEELWEQLLRLCPSTHHDLLRLKRRGASLAEIAASTGLHESSVRRILYELWARLGGEDRLEAACEHASVTV